MLTDQTPTQRALRTFLRNPLAVAAGVFIVLSVMVSLLGYLVMPDSTPQANDMNIQLSLKKPGTSFTFLRIHKRHKVAHVNLFQKIWSGAPEAYNDVPIVKWRFAADSIFVNEYIGAEDKPEQHAFNIFEVVNGRSALSANSHQSYQRLYTQIEQENIVKKTFWLGTDIYGRDLLSRLILGSRISLSVGLMAVLISLTIGVSLGALAGYYGGKTDAALSWVMNILWALPALLLVIALSFALGKGLWQIYVAVGLSMWVEVARLVRGQVIAIKQTEYIEAARALGYNSRRIITKHICPI